MCVLSILSICLRGYEIWSWHSAQTEKGIIVTETSFMYEYMERLGAQITGADDISEQTLAGWKRRLLILEEDGKAAAQVQDRLFKKLRLGAFCVQLLSDLSQLQSLHHNISYQRNTHEASKELRSMFVSYIHIVHVYY